MFHQRHRNDDCVEYGGAVLGLLQNHLFLSIFWKTQKLFSVFNLLLFGVNFFL